MKYLVILMSSMCLVGCGADWNGTYVGTLSQSGTCSDGSTASNLESSVTVTLKDEGDTVTWEAACGATVIADIDDDAANVRQVSCPAETLTDGTTRSTTIESGTLELDDSVVRMELELFVTLSGTLNGTCNLTAEGSLNRLEE
jgi:hypothetical protein